VDNLGIGKLAPFWYSLDVAGAVRLPTISSVFIQASSFAGNGGGLFNVPNTGVSSLSSVVSYGLSSLGGLVSPGVSTLSSILSYGLSTIARQPNPGISSLSSIVSYGLSTIAQQAGNTPGLSSLSSIVSYGLSTIARQPNPGISSLSSIISYGLSTIGQQPNPGISSLSSIVSYGLSTFKVALSTFSTSISQSFTTSSLNANFVSSSYGSFSTLSTGNILVGYVTSPLQVDVGVTTPIVTTSNLVATYGYIVDNLGIGKEAPFWYSLDVAGAARLPTISSVFIQASSFAGNGGGLFNVPNSGVSSLSSIVSYGLSSLGGQVATGLSSLSSVVSYGLSSISTAIFTTLSNNFSKIMATSALYLSWEYFS